VNALAGLPSVAAFRLPVPPTLSEADLSLLWEGQRFPPAALVSTQTGRLRVVYRGRRTGGPGPDFRDAIIACRSELLQGDVELHMRASDFRRHGHHRDPAYDGVVLHVVFQDDDGAPTELASGRRAPVAALGAWASTRAEDLRRRLEGPPLWQEPCFTAVERLGTDGAAAALDRLGDMRFRQKAATAARDVAAGGGLGGLEQTLWEGILEALGFGGQRELFSSLASGLQWRTLADTLVQLPPRERRPYAYRLLSEHLELARLRVPLILRPLRPANRPEARVKGAAALAARFAGPGLWGALAPLVEEAAVGRPGRLVAALSVPNAVGRARSIEIITNAVLPAVAAAGGAEAESAFRSLPLPARYGAVRHIRSALAGEVRLNARRQQGMLYLLKQYCTQGGCGRCPLS
jgi:hypothetical protein